MSSSDPSFKSDIVSGMNLSKANASLITLALVEFNKYEKEIIKILKQWMSKTYDNQAKLFVDLLFAQFTAKQISKLLYVCKWN